MDLFVLQSHQLQGRQSREDDDGEKLNMIERLEKAEGRIMSLEKQVRGSFSKNVRGSFCKNETQ